MRNIPELLRSWQRGTAPPPPVATALGLVLESVEPGQAVIGYEANGRHANPMGTLHGGLFCDIADAAMSAAYVTTLGEGESFATLELKINFLRPVWNARLRAVAKIVSAGRTTGLAECNVLDEKDRLVARASGTFITLRGEQAQGR